VHKLTKTVEESSAGLGNLIHWCRVHLQSGPKKLATTESSISRIRS